MYMRFSTLLLVLLLASCSSLKPKGQGSSLEDLYQKMSGTFTSAAQAAMDSTYYDISLRMYPIWVEEKDAKWLYVEQAVTAMKKQPYRQRVYRLTENAKGVFESKVYEIEKPEDYIHLWENPEKLSQLSQKNLIDREGCSVFLKASKDGTYTGSTLADACKSTLRGASYASSTVMVSQDKIVSWDQGFNAKGEQVWGAEKGGYVFMRQKED